MWGMLDGCILSVLFLLMRFVCTEACGFAALPTPIHRSSAFQMFIYYLSMQLFTFFFLRNARAWFGGTSIKGRLEQSPNDV